MTLTYRTVIFTLISLNSLTAFAFEDKSSLSTVDMAVCTAAAMKSGQGIQLYTTWANALEARYKRIYSNKSQKEIESYTVERVLDKRKKLNNDGISTTPAFKNFYTKNCADYAPQN